MKKIGILIALMVFSAVTYGIAASNVKTKALTPENYPIRGSHLENEMTCLDCHTENEPYTNRVKQETCFNCHEDYEALAKKTEKLGYDDNIHASPHYPKMDCDLCHKTHDIKTTVYCAMCHSQSTMLELVAP